MKTMNVSDFITKQGVKNNVVINGIKITLKAFRKTAGHDDSLPFVASLYINNKKCATVYNDGWGGEAMIDNVTDSNLIGLADKAISNCKELSNEYITNLAVLCDSIACYVEMEQYIKKNEGKYLIYEKPNGYVYCLPIMRGNKRVPIKDLSAESIKNFVHKHLAIGEKCLNTNLPKM